MMRLIVGLAVGVLAVACSSLKTETTPDPSPVARLEALPTADQAIWRKQVIYLSMPDRFFNGSASNDNLGAANCYDPANTQKFHGGDWAGLRQKIAYLKDLGATALWVTPANKQVGNVNNSFGFCGYHGYWASLANPDDGALEPKMGTAADLNGLITDLHNNNMKFILDVVVNHAGYNAPITSSNPTWFQTGPCPDDITCPLAGLPDFKHQDTNAATYLTNMSKGWAQRHALDGIRMDTVKHVLPSYFQNSWVPGIRSVKNNMFLVGELLDAGSLSRYTTYLNTGFDSMFNFYLRSALVDTFAKAGSVDGLAARVQDTITTFGLNQALLMTNLLDNHDVPRFTNEPGFGVAEADIRARHNLGLSALFTLPGIPQIYYGNEIGMYGGTDPDNRKDMPTWAFDNATRASASTGTLTMSNPNLTYNHLKKLGQIRAGTPALYDGYYAEMWRQNGSGANVYAFYRGSGSSRVIVAFNNGTAASGNIALDIQANTGINAADRTALTNGTVFTDAIAGGTATVAAGKLTINIPAQTAVIYRAGATATSTNSVVTFKVRASTTFGQNIYLIGNVADLGAWNLANKTLMTASNCTGSTCDWTVTKNLAQNQAIQFKFTRDNTYEGGSNRSYTVPAAATGSYNGGNFQ